MLVDLKDIKFDEYGVVQPTLSLHTLYGSTLGYIGLWFNLKLTLRYNDVSEAHFDIPSHYIEDGELVETPCYKELTGMKIVDIAPYGRFILQNPEVSDDGIRKIKSCTLYSLEYELANKNIFLSSGTYNFYNPVDINDTIISVIKETLPNWNIGDIDTKLLGKYRTLDNEANDNLYSFMMNTLQTKYGCLFLFDTKTRTIHVKSTSSPVERSPVYLSFNNLIKDANVTELNDEIITALSVYGADPLSIRNVNPMGSNMIYDLSHFISNGDLPEAMAIKWKAWKQNFDEKQTYYGNLGIEYNIELTNKTVEEANLNKLKGELLKLETLRSTMIAAVGEGINKQSDLDAVNRDIDEKDKEIELKEADIKIITDKLETMMEERKSINKSCAFSAFFTPEEEKILNLYFKESSITESSFVLSTIDYKNENITRDLNNYELVIDNGDIKEISVDPSTKRRLFDFTLGYLSLSKGNDILTGDIKNITFEVKADTNEFLLTCFLNGISDTIDGKTFEYPSADLSIKGKLSGFKTTESKLNFKIVSSLSFLQFGVTEYQQLVIEKELYDFGVESLNKLAHPSYQFSLNSGNFLFNEEFVPFKDSIKLGNAVYLNLDDENVIYPILLEMEIDFESQNNFSVTFSDKFTMRNKSGDLVDLLGNTINTSRKTDSVEHNYAEFKDSGASSQVKNYMNSNLDVAKNAITTSSGLEVQIDGAGIHMKKKNPNGDGYLPEQIRIIDNCIAFTDDGWKTAKMAMGKFNDPNLGNSWGLVAPSIVGTLLAGENLVIENVSPNGKNVQFKVDGSGVYVNNARILCSYGDTQIAIDASLGLAIGLNPLYSIDPATNELKLNEENAKLFANKNGQLKVTGTLYGTDGEFIGDIKARNFFFQDGNDLKTLLSKTQKKIPAEFLELRGLVIINDATGLPVFTIDNAGNVYIANGVIKWDSPLIEYQYSSNNSSWHDKQQSGDIYRRERVAGGSWGTGYQFIGKNGANGSDGSDANVPEYIKSTYIDGTSVSSPVLRGGTVTGARLVVTGEIATGTNDPSELAVYDSKGNKYGYIRYDVGDIETPQEARERMFICTETGKALKIRSGANMSISAPGGRIYMDNVTFTNNPEGVYARFK